MGLRGRWLEIAGNVRAWGAGGGASFWCLLIPEPLLVHFLGKLRRWVKECWEIVTFFFFPGWRKTWHFSFVIGKAGFFAFGNDRVFS